MKLGTRGRYAMVALTDVALQPSGQVTTLNEISRRQNISMTYLEQLFVKLRRKGIVESVRGPGGGYRLALRPEQIRVHEVLAAVEESVNALEFGAGAKGGVSGSHAQSLANQLWEGLSAHVYVYLHHITMADVIANELIPCPALSEFNTV